MGERSMRGRRNDIPNLTNAARSMREDNTADQRMSMAQQMMTHGMPESRTTGATNMGVAGKDVIKEEQDVSKLKDYLGKAVRDQHLLNRIKERINKEKDILPSYKGNKYENCLNIIFCLIAFACKEYILPYAHIGKESLFKGLYDKGIKEVDLKTLKSLYENTKVVQYKLGAEFTEFFEKQVKLQARTLLYKDPKGTTITINDTPKINTFTNIEGILQKPLTVSTEMVPIQNGEKKQLSVPGPVAQNIASFVDRISDKLFEEKKNKNGKSAERS
jgi:hypothetical protein